VERKKWVELGVPAKIESWARVRDFLESYLEKRDCTPREQTQVLIAAEEIFINIASYAYEGEGGSAVVRLKLEQGNVLSLQFEDGGKPYNPLENEDPDIALSAEEREVGGLGIYLVKKSMDNVTYQYVDGKNCLTLVKRLKYAGTSVH